GQGLGPGVERRKLRLLGGGRDEAPAHRPRRSLPEMMVSEDLARSDVVTRTPVAVREPCDAKFLRDRLAGLHVMRPHMATVKVLIGSLADSRSGALRPYPMPVTLPM